jgi:acetyl esterase
MPPAFLAIAECDILAEQNIAMTRRLREYNVPAESIVYPGASHSFIEAMSIAEVSNDALSDAAEWLKQVLLQPGLGPSP